MRTSGKTPRQYQFSEMSTEEVKQLLETASREIEQRNSAQKTTALRQVQEIVRKHDLEFEEVVAAVRTTSRRKKAPPLFRNPENPRQTWSGKGEPPDWYLNHPEPESLRIQGTYGS